MRYMSVCSGVEAASLAFAGLGWEPLAFSEIEPYPCAVLKSRFPEVPNLGDMTKIEVKENEIRSNGIAVRRADVDLLVGGTPCQSFSVAGSRKGLAGASGLAYHFARLLREIRPRFFIWENVPGALSSRTDGRFDFNFLVREYAQCGYDLAWRVLDAQYVRSKSFPFAIPQRRRRVFVVGCLAGCGTSPSEILFVGEGLHGDSAPRRISWKGTSEDSEGRAGETGGLSFQERAGKPGGGKGILTQKAHIGCLSTLNNQFVTQTFDCIANQFMPPKDGTAEVSHALRAEQGCGVGVTCAFIDNLSEKTRGIGYAEEESPTVTTDNCISICQPACFQQNQREEVRFVGDGHVAGSLAAEPGVHQQNYCMVLKGGQSPSGRLGLSKDTSPTISAMQSSLEPTVCVPSANMVLSLRTGHTHANGVGVQEDACHTIRAKGGDAGGGSENLVFYDNHPQDSRVTEAKGAFQSLSSQMGTGGNNTPMVGVGYSVRRITPTEAERLMGFPDGWTIPCFRPEDITDELCEYFRKVILAWDAINAKDGKTPKPKSVKQVRKWLEEISEGKSDSPRYKACGNSMCVNCMEWLAERIEFAINGKEAGK